MGESNLIELLALIALYLLLGSAAGVMAGLLGVGGGLIIVPGVVGLLHLQGVWDGPIMQLAVGTSLATIVITSISSVRAHHKRGAVLWPVVWSLSPGIVLGALVGAKVADWLPSDTLRIVFALFVLSIAAQMAFAAKPAAHRGLPGSAGMWGAGGVIGGLSAIVGIGGGSLTVPFLTWCNTDMRQAVATSSACGLPIALSGSAAFIFNGWGHAQLPAWSLGYIYGPALVGIALASMWTAPLGAKLAHTLPVAMLKRVFAGFLLLVGLKMLLS